jgi:hypothetical protein
MGASLNVTEGVAAGAQAERMKTITTSVLISFDFTFILYDLVFHS